MNVLFKSFRILLKIYNPNHMYKKTPKDPLTQSNTITVKTTQHTTQQSINKNKNYIIIPQPSNPLTLSKHFHRKCQQ